MAFDYEDAKAKYGVAEARRMEAESRNQPTAPPPPPPPTPAGAAPPPPPPPAPRPDMSGYATPGGAQRWMRESGGTMDQYNQQMGLWRGGAAPAPNVPAPPPPTNAPGAGGGTTPSSPAATYNCPPSQQKWDGSRFVCPDGKPADVGASPDRATQTQVDVSGLAIPNWNHPEANSMTKEYKRLVAAGVNPAEAERIVRTAIGGLPHDYERGYAFDGGGQFGSPEDTVNQYWQWERFRDDACPPDAPYRGEFTGKGCWEHPQDDQFEKGAPREGWNKGAQGGGGGQGGSGGGAPAAGAPAGGGAMDDMLSYWKNLVKQGDSRYSPEAMARLEADQFSRARAQEKLQLEQARQDQALRGVSRSTNQNANVRQIGVGTGQQIMANRARIQQAKIEADYQDKQQAINNAQNWVNSMRDYLLRGDANAIAREQIAAQIRMAERQIAAQRSLVDQQYRNQRDLMNLGADIDLERQILG